MFFLLVIGGVRMSKSSERDNFAWKMPAASGIAAWCLTGILVAACVAPPTAEAEEAVRYNRDIRPIFARICFECHGPDSASRAADLRLDKRTDAIELEVIVPGEPEDSLLSIASWQRIHGTACHRPSRTRR